ncbi:hypothetical protein E2C01_046151 [Portunus trituberculatus]|uniref:Uncharacterized protein n=1 Tax=Portunus trituberculatus TaxID=210409 RepID=A0A5B7G3W7_PORTR|nr:hypothetical protein [Portunus trituberculatus]
MFFFFPSFQNLLLSLEERDAEELVLVLQGYYRLLTENPLPLTHARDRHAHDQVLNHHCSHVNTLRNPNTQHPTGKQKLNTRPWQST